TTFDAPNLIPIADATIAGNTSAATAGIDALVRAGTNRVQTVTASGTTFTTPLPHNFSDNDGLIFTVSGGTAYSGINTHQLYMVVSVPTSTTFTAAPMINGVRSGTSVNAGSAGTGTMSVGDSPNRFSSIFTISQWEYTGFQNLAVNGFSPAPAGGTPNTYWYEGALELGGSPYTAAQYTAIGMVTPSVPNVTTGTTHGTTVIDSIASVANTFPGEVASAADITASQTILSVNSGCPTTCTGNYVVLSAVASGSNSGEAVTFTGTSALSVSNMATAINNWRLDLATSSATLQAYYNTFMGTQSGAIT